MAVSTHSAFEAYASLFRNGLIPFPKPQPLPTRSTPPNPPPPHPSISPPHRGLSSTCKPPPTLQPNTSTSPRFVLDREASPPQSAAFGGRNLRGLLPPPKGRILSPRLVGLGGKLRGLLLGREFSPETAGGRHSGVGDLNWKCPPFHCHGHWTLCGGV